jgi:hypothetical protein
MERGNEIMGYNLDKLVNLRKWAGESNDFDLRFWATKNECGTTLCLAGHTVVADGYEIVWPTFPSHNNAYQGQECVRPGETPLYINDVARELLGLNHEEAEQLFTPTLTENAMEAANASEPDQVDPSELEEHMALDFLDALIKRARVQDVNMSEGEVVDWHYQWAMQHHEELAGTLVDH